MNDKERRIRKEYKEYGEIKKIRVCESRWVVFLRFAMGLDPIPVTPIRNCARSLYSVNRLEKCIVWYVPETI